jgi:2',3'-cyclic-nucleotide 2'-phosphodiesterase (5'-nucleotidase family)
VSNRAIRAAIACAVAVCGVVAGTTASANQPSSKPRRSTLDLQLLSFNDFHGHLQPPGSNDAVLGPELDPSGTLLGGAAYLSTTLTQLRAGYDDEHGRGRDRHDDDRDHDRGRGRDRASLTVAAGDLIGGSPFLSGLFHDEPAVESLDALGLDVSSVGNHEFDEGVTELLRMQRGGCHPDEGCYPAWGPRGYPGADFDWLAANVIGPNQRPILPAYSIENINGVKVGFIGMTLEDTPTLVAQSGIQGIEFKDEVETANATARQLRRRGVATIVVLLHEGGRQTGTYEQCVGPSGPIVEIAENLSPAIDLVVTGHTHQPYICNIPDPNGQPRMVTSASSFGRVVTETHLIIDRRTGDVIRNASTSTNHLVTRTVAPDPAQTEIIDRWNALSAPIANRVVGAVTADLTPAPNRDAEAVLTNIIADAQLAATAAPGDGGAQIAFMNPGGVRASLTFGQVSGGEAPGQVTYGEAFAVQPFGNLLVTMDLTGAQIERLLEQQAVQGRPGGRDILILGVSNGFTFTYDPNRAIGDRIDPASIMLNGTVLDPAATYRIVTNNFLADGGDAFTVFREGTNRVGGGDDLAALLAYLAANSPLAPVADRIAGI